jgi:hypothetical protein
MNLFTFLWNEILVLIFNMVIYMQRLAIQFVEMHCTRMHISFLYILISIRVTIAFYLQTDTCLQLKKNNYSIFILYWFPIFVLYWFPTFILYWFPTFILYWFPTFVLYYSFPHPFWNVTVLWPNTTTIVIIHIRVVFSRKNFSASLPNANQNGPTSI